MDAEIAKRFQHTHPEIVGEEEPPKKDSDKK